MLKAVRFDEERHQHLLKFINEYADPRGRLNESEGIRFLMEKGFEALNSNPIEPILPDLDIKEDIKAIMEKLNNLQLVTVTQPTNQSTMETPTVTSKPKPKQVEIPKDVNPLLANILANANRQ